MTMTPAQPLHRLPELMGFIERQKLPQCLENYKVPIKGAHYQLSPERWVSGVWEMHKCFSSRATWEALVTSFPLEDPETWVRRCHKERSGLNGTEGGQAVCQDQPGSLHNTLFSIRHTLAPRKERALWDIFACFKNSNSCSSEFEAFPSFPTKLRPYRVISYWGAPPSSKPGWNLR